MPLREEENNDRSNQNTKIKTGKKAAPLYPLQKNSRSFASVSL